MTIFLPKNQARVLVAILQDYLAQVGNDPLRKQRRITDQVGSLADILLPQMSEPRSSETP